MNITAELHVGAHALMRKNPSLRYGQALSTCLHEIRPDLAAKVQGTDADPFYLDERVAAFFRFLAEETQPITPEDE